MVVLHSQKGCKKKNPHKHVKNRKEMGKALGGVGTNGGALDFGRKGATRRFPLGVVIHPLRTRGPADTLV